MASRPMPFQAKMFSTTIAPPIMYVNCRPIIVTTGTSPERMTWAFSTMAFGRPLAWAVRTKSWLITSIMLDRVMRATMAALLSPKVTARRIRFAGPVPATGSQPRFTAKTNISTSPSQKCGIDTPAMAPIIRPESSQAPRR